MSSRWSITTSSLSDPEFRHITLCRANLSSSILFSPTIVVLVGLAGQACLLFQTSSHIIWLITFTKWFRAILASWELIRVPWTIPRITTACSSMVLVRKVPTHILPGHAIIELQIRRQQPALPKAVILSHMHRVNRTWDNSSPASILLSKLATLAPAMTVVVCSDE